MARWTSLSRFLKVGSLAGGVLGGLFGLAVVSLADCAGPGCTGERVLGVAGHALAGALLGVAAGGVAWALVRAARG